MPERDINVIAARVVPLFILVTGFGAGYFILGGVRAREAELIAHGVRVEAVVQESARERREVEPTESGYAYVVGEHVYHGVSERWLPDGSRETAVFERSHPEHVRLLGDGPPGLLDPLRQLSAPVRVASGSATGFLFWLAIARAFRRSSPVSKNRLAETVGEESGAA